MLSDASPARAISGGPNKGTAREEKELTVWTIEVATKALPHKGNFKARFQPLAGPNFGDAGPLRECAVGALARLGAKPLQNSRHSRMCPGVPSSRRRHAFLCQGSGNAMAGCDALCP